MEKVMADSKGSDDHLGGQPLVTPPALGMPTASGDYWSETTTAWVRVHLESRNQLFRPPEIAEEGGPILEALSGVRVSLQTRDGRPMNRYRDNFKEIAEDRMFRPWTGQTILYKAGADPPARSAAASSVPLTGEEVLPESLGGAMTVLRGELAAAQRMDPGLAQVIAYLEKHPASTFLDQPRRDMQKVKARAERFTMAPDGVLLGIAGTSGGRR